MMTIEQLTALHSVVQYLLEDESEHYWESDGGADHIYHDVITLQEYLDDEANEESTQEQRPDWHDQADGEYEGWENRWSG